MYDDHEPNELPSNADKSDLAPLGEDEREESPDDLEPGDFEDEDEFPEDDDNFDGEDTDEY